MTTHEIIYYGLAAFVGFYIGVKAGYEYKKKIASSGLEMCIAHLELSPEVYASVDEAVKHKATVAKLDLEIPCDDKILKAYNKDRRIRDLCQEFFENGNFGSNIYGLCTPEMKQIVMQKMKQLNLDVGKGKKFNS